jgi:hypothetical protein
MGFVILRIGFLILSMRFEPVEVEHIVLIRIPNYTSIIRVLSHPIASHFESESFKSWFKIGCKKHLNTLII